MLIYNNKYYSREDVIGLTGIRALHSINDPHCTVEFTQVIKGKNDELLATITSPYFKLYIIKIIFISLRLENFLIVSSGLEHGISERCLKLQVFNAMKLSFANIELVAERRDRPSKIKGVLVERLIGYKVWGKYGFLMYEKTQAKNFKEFMNENNCPSISLIRHIYKSSDQALRGKKIWDVSGTHWRGMFNLNPYSTSYKVLQGKI